MEIGTIYSPTWELMRSQTKANKLNYKAQAKLNKVVRKISAHEDYSDEGLNRLLTMDTQRAALVEEIVANERVCREEYDALNKKNGY